MCSHVMMQTGCMNSALLHIEHMRCMQADDADMCLSGQHEPPTDMRMLTKHFFYKHLSDAEIEKRCKAQEEKNENRCD